MARRSKAAQSLEFVDDLEVWITRKRIRNVNLRVKPPDGRIEVSAPLSTPTSTILDFVSSRRGWIERQRARIAESTESKAAAASPEEQREWRVIVEAVVPGIVAKWERVLGVRAGKLAYRNMKSRWGSCQPSTGRICINTRLALYPPECLEYIVVHELCHLRVRGHGPEFHALVESVMPDWRQRAALLRG